MDFFPLARIEPSLLMVSFAPGLAVAGGPCFDSALMYFERRPGRGLLGLQSASHAFCLSGTCF